MCTACWRNLPGFTSKVRTKSAPGSLFSIGQQLSGAVEPCFKRSSWEAWGGMVDYIFLGLLRPFLPLGGIDLRD